jgi:hypothetical protein
MPYASIWNLLKNIDAYKNFDFEKIYASVGLDYSGVYCQSFLNFEKGEIKFTGKTTPKAKAEEIAAKIPLIKSKFNDKLLEDFPASTYMASKFSVNIDEYVKLMTRTFEEFANSATQNQAELEAELEAETDSVPEEYYEYEDYKTNYEAAALQNQSNEMLKAFNNPTFKTVIEALDGDLLLNIYGFAQGPLPIPLAGIGFTVKSEEAFENLLALLPEDVKQKTNDGDKFYTYTVQGVVSLYYAYRDKRVLITDDADVISAFVEKGQKNSLKNLKDSEIAKHLGNDFAYFYFNLDLSSYPVSIQTLLKENLRPEKEALKLLEAMKDFSYGGSNYSDFYVSLKFKDTKQNSLKVLFDLVDSTIAEKEN